jgi:hypothetical protein
MYRENRCRRKHHQLLHVEKGLEKEVQGEQSPAESSIAASVSGSAQGEEQWSLGQLAAQWIRTPKGGPCLAFWDSGSQVTLITNRAVQAMGLQAVPSPFVRLQCVGNDRGTTAKARYKVPLLDIGGRVVTLLAFGIENIMSPWQEGDLASMKAAFPDVPTGGGRGSEPARGARQPQPIPSGEEKSWRCRIVREPVRNRVHRLRQAASSER